MSDYSKVNSVSHDRVDDVDSFYECGISLAQNIDGDNEEYVVSKIDGTSVDDTEMEDGFLPDNNQGPPILLPEGRRYHFGRRRSMSTSEIMDLELARTFDNVTAMIASYTSRKDTDSEDNTPISTPRSRPKFLNNKLDSSTDGSNNSRLQESSQMGGNFLSPAGRGNSNQPSSPQSPVQLRKREGSSDSRSMLAENNELNTPPNKKRSSVLVHDNDDVLNLADEVHFREMFLNRSKESTTSSSNNNMDPSSVDAKSSTSMEESIKSSTGVRRNSSGYSTSSGGSTISSTSKKEEMEETKTSRKAEGIDSRPSLVVIRKEGQHVSSNTNFSSTKETKPSKHSIDGKTSSSSSIAGSLSVEKNTKYPETLSPSPKLRNKGKRSSSPRNHPRYRTVPQGDDWIDLKQVQQNRMYNRRASVCPANVNHNQQLVHEYQGQTKQEKEPSAHKSSVGSRLSNMFTTKHRDSPSAKKIERKIAMERQKSQEQSQNDRHKEFVQTRSKTGINSFFSGRRRQSIAITDDAYNSAIRAAKSHYDLSVIAHQGGKGKDTKVDEKNRFSKGNQQTSPIKPASAIPLHLQLPAGLGTASAASTPTTRMKFGLKERPWTELERLWKGKTKDPPGPNIDFMLKPHVSFASDRRGSDARAMTLPIEPADVREAERNLKAAGANHRSLTASESVPYSSPTNKQKLSAEKHTRSKTIKGYPPRQSSKPDLVSENESHHNQSNRTGSNNTFSKSADVVVTAPSPTVNHRRTPSGGMVTSWISPERPSHHHHHHLLDHFHSPHVVKKAVDLLAPTIIHDWQMHRGYHRGASAPNENSKLDNNEKPQHFQDLLNHW